MTEIKEIIIISIAEFAEVKAVRYAKGYGWELHLYGNTLLFISDEIKQKDEQFRERYDRE